MLYGADRFSTNTDFYALFSFFSGTYLFTEKGSMYFFGIFCQVIETFSSLRCITKSRLFRAREALQEKLRNLK